MTAPPSVQKATSRVANAMLWLGPVFFLLWLYWDGLQCWFIADDFAWLGLIRQYHGPGDLFSLLLAPAAQGTIRPWSERGFFLLFESLFGLDDLPFRITAFVTMSLNLLLLAWLTRRITKSPVAAFVAAVVWSANTALVTTMTWSSAFNEALCSFFLLSTLALFIRFAESGRRFYWWCQFGVFVLGFGALEINVIYPALAASWALFAASRQDRKRLLLSIVPLAAVSILYFFLHRAVVSLPTTGAYVLHFDARIFRTLVLYGKWSLLPVDWQAFGHSARTGKLILSGGIGGLILLFVSEVRKQRSTALFFVSWFVAALIPVLPLPDHHTDYYLTIPLLGLAMLAAWGYHVAAVSPVWRLVAVTVIVGYLAGMVPVSHAATNWWLRRTLPIRALVLGIQAAHESHPGKIILLDGITPALYSGSIGQGAFYAARTDFSYLTPGSELNIESAPDLADPASTVLDAAVTLHAIRKDQIVVYSVAGDHLRNITEAYERSAPNRFPALADIDDPLPDRIDVGNPLYSWLLSPNWMPSESGVRWMPGKASVRIRVPRAGTKLLLEGFFPEEQLKQIPRHLVVVARGVGTGGGELVLGETQIGDPESTFRRLFAIPQTVVGRDSVEIEIRVDPVTRKDGQEYGVVFGKITVLH